MTDVEQKALYTITRLSMKPSGPVMRPTSELVAYAHLLELMLSTRDSVLVQQLREYIVPHWADVLRDMEVE